MWILLRSYISTSKKAWFDENFKRVGSVHCNSKASSHVHWFIRTSVKFERMNQTCQHQLCHLNPKVHSRARSSSTTKREKFKSLTLHIQLLVSVEKPLRLELQRFSPNLGVCMYLPEVCNEVRAACDVVASDYAILTEHSNTRQRSRRVQPQCLIHYSLEIHQLAYV